MGFGNLAGAALFLVLTPIMWFVYYTNSPRGAEEPVRLVVGLAAVLLLFRLTRTVGAGFFMGFLALTVLTGGRMTTIWWEELNPPIRRLTQPFSRWFRARTEHRAWIANRRGYPVDVKDGLMLLSNLHSGCVPSYTRPPGTPVPADVADIMRRPDCDRFKPFLFDDDAAYPQRYFASDSGWRWQYVRTGQDAHGEPNFRIVLRPDPQLELPGPILEVTGDGWYRIRESDSAPLRIFATPIPMMRRLRECVMLAASEAARNPRYPVLWEWLSQPSYIHGVCRDLDVRDEQDSPEGDHVTVVRPHGSPDPRASAWLHYRALAPDRFEIRARAFGRRYLLDADGTLHAASAAGSGAVTDGPPEPCEIDATVACHPR